MEDKDVQAVSVSYNSITGEFMLTKTGPDGPEVEWLKTREIAEARVHMIVRAGFKRLYPSGDSGAKCQVSLTSQPFTEI